MSHVSQPTITVYSPEKPNRAAVIVFPGGGYRIRVTRDTPPTFLLHAENDNVDGPSHSLVYYDTLKNSGVPVEMHLYAEGRHAFGLRPTKFPITRWPSLVETWLQTIAMVP